MGAAMAIKAPFLMHSVIFLRLQKMTRPVGIA